MSVSHTVFLMRAKLPTRDAWQRALSREGFELVLDPELDPAHDDGYVPCKLAGADAGFEYFVQSVESYLADHDGAERRVRLGGGDIAISFVTHSRVADLHAAMAACAVLATLSGGLVWSDDAGDFIHNPLRAARDIAAEETGRPPPEPAQPHSIATDVAARCVFRGTATTILETLEPTPRRFTVKVGVREPEVRIMAMWQHPVGSSTIHRLRAGDTVHEIDPKGAAAMARPIAASIAELGRTETATRELLAVGAPAVLPLCGVVTDARQPVDTRRIAIVILGQLRDRRAEQTLAAIAQDAELGGVARQALANLSR